MTQVPTQNDPQDPGKEQPKKPGRRRFLKTAALVTGGLVVGIPLLRDEPGPVPHLAEQALTPNAFVQITPAGEVHFYLPASEMGQGVYHGLTTLLAEELRLPPDHIQVHAAGVHAAFANPAMGRQATGGSTSMAGFYQPLRRAGAQARELLLQAAAAELGQPLDRLELRDGQIHSGDSSYDWGRFAERAASLPVPAEPQLTAPADWRFIGQDRPRVDALAKATGTATFGLDVDFPGLKRAVVKHAPVIGAKLLRYDASQALEMPGVIGVYPIAEGVGVVAEHYWQARKAADTIALEWDEPPLAAWSSEALDEAMISALDQPEAEEVERRGTPLEALATATTVVEADYSVPYLAHAAMEPMNCTVRLDGDHCEIWTGNQGPQGIQGTAAFQTGLAADKITVHSTFVGGSFGRRAYADFVREALQLAQASGEPIQLLWSREDDMRHDFYRPAARARFRAGLDENGRLQSCAVRRAGPNVLNYALEEFAGSLAPALMPDALVRWAGQQLHPVFNRWTVDPLSVEGLFANYQSPSLLLEHVTVDPGLRTGFWRAVGHSFSGFFKESFMDEMAVATDQDPLDFRLSHLPANSRLVPVLQAVAKLANWGQPVPGRGLGLAVHESFGSVVAQVAEVSVAQDRIQVHRISCVVDCGLAVNPQLVRSQMESSIVYGLSAALYGRIDLDQGAVRQSNFHDYPPLRLPEAPEVVVEILPSERPPSGVGEPGLPPLAPAVANAVYAASGQRLRHLPLQLA
ncbi:MAG: xanthine dehydrogenase family protein molybdopterin-binding subunit [Xanthomonadales bacterium]|nr:xanthine dehydrogenase family protein molybdopterin-binding subunit [Xanthomonadales bacterium]